MHRLVYVAIAVFSMLVSAAATTTTLVCARSPSPSPSRANLASYNRMTESIGRTFFVVPAANRDDPANSTAPNLQFTLAVPELPTATTGRFTRLQNPAAHFHVYPPQRSGTPSPSSCGNRSTVSAQAIRNNCISATNLSPFSYKADALCEGPLVSDGAVLVTKPAAGAACLGILRPTFGNFYIVGNALAITESKYFQEEQFLQLACGFEMLVVNGTALTSADALIAPRTALGIDANGNLVTMVAEGSETAHTGLTLNGTAAWLASAEIGVQWAVNFDGGGSSTMFFTRNGGIQGCPSGIDIPVCVEREVASTTCIY